MIGNLLKTPFGYFAIGFIVGCLAGVGALGVIWNAIVTVVGSIWGNASGMAG